MTVATLKTAPALKAEATVDVLQSLLEQAKAGELIAVTVVAEYQDATYNTIGTSSMSRLWTAGALLEASIHRLEQNK